MTLVVDGIETKSSGVSVSAIKSVSINNDPYTAEARSPGKGRIEFLTKAGTPRFHGTFNFTFRDASTDAITPFAIAPPVEQRCIYEGNITLLRATRVSPDLFSETPASIRSHARTISSSTTVIRSRQAS